MFEQVLAEEILENKKLFVKGVLGFGAIGLLDCLLPHTHKLPLLELLEKAELFDMVVRVTFNEPLTKRYEFDWSVILIQSQTFAAQSVVLLWLAIVVRGNLKVVRIPV